jgi:heat shock transcription factor
MNRPLATRKRGAPGASPLAQQQNFNNAPYTGIPDQNAYDQSFNDWGSANGLNNLNNGFLADGSLDNGVYNGGLNGAANFGAPGAGQLGNDFTTDGQLVKRGQNQQVVAANPNSWQDGEGSAQPVPSFEQVVDEDDDLEQKALAAKKEAQSKRKQIPPFVQKLSRSAQ